MAQVQLRLGWARLPSRILRLIEANPFGAQNVGAGGAGPKIKPVTAGSVQSDGPSVRGFIPVKPLIAAPMESDGRAIGLEELVGSWIRRIGENGNRLQKQAEDANDEEWASTL